mgnify:CR=1 FL=1
MGMSLDAYLFYGRPAKGEGVEFPDGAWELRDQLRVLDVDYVFFGASDYQEPAIVVASTLVSAYYGAKAVPANVRGSITDPIWRTTVAVVLDRAFELLGLDDADFEPAGWFIAPSYS